MTSVLFLSINFCRFGHLRSPIVYVLRLLSSKKVWLARPTPPCVWEMLAKLWVLNFILSESAWVSSIWDWILSSMLRVSSCGRDAPLDDLAVSLALKWNVNGMHPAPDRPWTELGSGMDWSPAYPLGGILCVAPRVGDKSGFSSFCFRLTDSLRFCPNFAGSIEMFYDLIGFGEKKLSFLYMFSNLCILLLGSTYEFFLPPMEMFLLATISSYSSFREIDRGIVWICCSIKLRAGLVSLLELDTCVFPKLFSRFFSWF